MIDGEDIQETQASALCQACGLCCTGHLFIWVKLKYSELDPAEALGMTVFRSVPQERGFSQPCPLWKGVCTIYSSKHYPHACRAYRCKVLKDFSSEILSFPQAMTVIEQAKERIAEMESILPDAPFSNFRERVVDLLEHPERYEHEKSYPELRAKAESLLSLFEQDFGVNDFFA